MSIQNNNEPDCRVEVWEFNSKSFVFCEMYFYKPTQNYLLTRPLNGPGSDLSTIEVTEAEMMQGEMNKDRIRLHHIIIKNGRFIPAPIAHSGPN